MSVTKNVCKLRITQSFFAINIQLCSGVLYALFIPIIETGISINTNQVLLEVQLIADCRALFVKHKLITRVTSGHSEALRH